MHYLTQKAVPFNWDTNCQQAFTLLKEALVQAPHLVYPRSTPTTPPFSLQADASAVGIGAVLEQGHVIAYASWSLTQAECPATVYGMKQYRHYLLGRPFTLVTDQEPLQCRRWKASWPDGPLLSRKMIFRLSIGRVNTMVMQTLYPERPLIHVASQPPQLHYRVQRQTFSKDRDDAVRCLRNPRSTFEIPPQTTRQDVEITPLVMVQATVATACAH